MIKISFSGVAPSSVDLIVDLRIVIQLVDVFFEDTLAPKPLLRA